MTSPALSVGTMRCPSLLRMLPELSMIQICSGVGKERRQVLEDFDRHYSANQTKITACLFLLFVQTLLWSCSGSQRDLACSPVRANGQAAFREWGHGRSWEAPSWKCSCSVAHLMAPRRRRWDNYHNMFCSFIDVVFFVLFLFVCVKLFSCPSVLCFEEIVSPVSNSSSRVRC